MIIMRDPEWIFLSSISTKMQVIKTHRDKVTGIIRDSKTLMTGRDHTIPVESTKRYHHPDNETISDSFIEAYRSAVRKGLINE
jgi:hypothetical protein